MVIILLQDIILAYTNILASTVSLSKCWYNCRRVFAGVCVCVCVCVMGEDI